MELKTCPTTKQLNQYLKGEIDGTLFVEVGEHILACSRCFRAAKQPDKLLEPTQSEPGDTATSGGFAPAPPSDWSRSSPLTDRVDTYSLSFLSPAVEPDELGRLANYRVLKVLGEGGMGMVLLAEDTQLQRPVALKVIRPEIGIYEESRQRFMREAMAMAAVKSEYVVTIHQVGEVNDTCFIAMELLEGESLDSMIDRECRPPLHQTLKIARQIAQALNAAHTKKLIHRDIKPENVWLEAPNAKVKLLDFGLARPQASSEKLTMTGAIMGTPSFMSPEQANGLEVDERSDLFSLGSLLYLMLSGQKPFRGPSLISTLMAIVEHNPAPPSELVSELPRSIDNLVMSLLTKQVGERIQTAVEVIAKITAIEEALPSASFDNTPFGMKGASVTRSASTYSTGLNYTSGNLFGDREVERRQLNLIVCNCDFFESEDYFELDSTERVKILQAYQLQFQEAILSFGGTVVECNKGNLLACFGYPTAFEDATLLAARCSLEVLRKIGSLGEKYPGIASGALSPRISLHAGLTFVETKGNEIILGGDTRKLALNLVDQATAGQAICSEYAQRLLKGRFECTELGQQKIRGLAQPISVYQIVSEHHIIEHLEHVLQHTDSLPVGRELEMSLLNDRWTQVHDGIGQVVLLSGEAGLGKSHVVQALKHNLRNETGSDSSAFVIELYCGSHFRNTSLHPFSSFFDHMLQLDGVETVEEKYKRLMSHLESVEMARIEVITVFASLLNLPAHENYPILTLAPARVREAAFSVLTEWLRVQSACKPVLFIVEDLHWSDNSTLQFLERFLGGGLNEQIMSLLTFRPEFRTPWQNLPPQTSISLNRLTKQQAGDLVREKAGQELPQFIVDQICERAGGVPLFIEEFTRMVVDSDLLTRTNSDTTGIRTLIGHAIPSTLQDLIMARLDRLEGNPDLAQLAAALGRTFSYEYLSAVAGLIDRQLQDELYKLVQGEILFEKGRPPKSTYVFKHALLQDALYNSLVKSKRRQIHQRIAEALELLASEGVEVRPEILAHHYTESGVIEKAINYWLSAGMLTQEKFANVEAISHFTAGLELLAIMPESTNRDNLELHLLTQLGSAYQAAHGYSAPVVGPTFARARELCEKTKDPIRLFEVMWGNWTWHLVRGELLLCQALADEMMTFAAATNDSGMIMEAHVAPAVTYFYRGRFEQCFEYCKEAIAKFENPEQCKVWAARTGQDASVVIRCYLALTLWHLGHPDMGENVINEALDLARKNAHPFSLGHALHFAGWFNRLCKRGEKIELFASEQIALANQHGFALWLASGTFLKGAGLMLQGRKEDGLPLMETGLKSFQAVSANLTVTSQLYVIGDGFLFSGMYEEALKAIELGLSLVEKNDDRYHEAELNRIRGEILLAQSGNDARVHSTAEACFRKALTVAQGQGSRAWQQRAACSLARLEQIQGRHGDGLKTLAAVNALYTEGLDLPDQVAARAQLAKSSGAI